MIGKEAGKFYLVCDFCEEPYEGDFDEFYEAVEAKKELGWRSRKDPKSGWLDICPECQKEG